MSYLNCYLLLIIFCIIWFGISIMLWCMCRWNLIQCWTHFSFFLGVDISAPSWALLFGIWKASPLKVMGLILLKPYPMSFKSSDLILFCCSLSWCFCMMTTISFSTHFTLADAMSSIFLTSLCPSSYMLGKYDGAGTNGKPSFVCVELVFLQKYIYLSDYVSIVPDVPINVALVLLCHLWVEVDTPGKQIVCFSHF